MSEKVIKQRREKIALVTMLIFSPMLILFMINFNPLGKIPFIFYGLCVVLNLTMRMIDLKKTSITGKMIREEIFGAILLGPMFFVIYLIFFIMESKYYRLSVHRGYFIRTKERDMIYAKNLLSGKVMPFGDEDG